jgi:hypothetical protein
MKMSDESYIAELVIVLEDVARNSNQATLIREAARTIKSQAEKNARLREALEKLARLGAEPYYGNSDGNMIARAALGET